MVIFYALMIATSLIRVRELGQIIVICLVPLRMIFDIIPPR